MTLAQQILRLRIFLFFLHSGMAILVSFFPVYLKNLGLTGSQVGWLVAVGPVASIFAQPLWGFISDKFKTVKWTLLTCLAISIPISVLLFQARSFYLLVILSYLFFSFVAPVSALGDSLVQRTANNFGVGFGKIRMWGSLGFASSALIAGQVFSFVGVKQIFWPYLFYLVATLLFSLTLVDIKCESKPVTLKDVANLRKSSNLLLFLWVILIVSITHRANDSFMGLYIYELGGGDSLVGWAWFIGVLSEAAIFASSGFLMKRFSEITLILLSAMIYTLRWIIFTNLTDPLHLVYLQFLQGPCFALIYVASFQMVSKLVPEELQSTGHLLFVSIFFGLAGILSGVLGGYIIEANSVRELYQYLAYTAFVGSIALAALKLKWNQGIILDSMKGK